MLWRKIAKYVLWRVEEKWKARLWGIWFGGGCDDQHRFSCMVCGQTTTGSSAMIDPSDGDGKRVD